MTIRNFEHENRSQEERARCEGCLFLGRPRHLISLFPRQTGRSAENLDPQAQAGCWRAPEQARSLPGGGQRARGGLPASRDGRQGAGSGSCSCAVGENASSLLGLSARAVSAPFVPDFFPLHGLLMRATLDEGSAMDARTLDERSADRLLIPVAAGDSPQGAVESRHCVLRGAAIRGGGGGLSLLPLSTLSCLAPLFLIHSLSHSLSLSHTFSLSLFLSPACLL